MRIYLAARYNRHPELQVYAKELEKLGHIVTASWIFGDQNTEALYGTFAQRDLQDLSQADCLISFTEMPEKTKSTGGRHVEFGFALALGLRKMIVGYKENIFHHLSSVEFYGTWEEVKRAL